MPPVITLPFKVKKLPDAVERFLQTLRELGSDAQDEQEPSGIIALQAKLEVVVKYSIQESTGFGGKAGWNANVYWELLRFLFREDSGLHDILVDAWFVRHSTRQSLRRTIGITTSNSVTEEKTKEKQRRTERRD